MRIPRIYTDQPLQPGRIVRLPEQAGEHLVRVLRLEIDHPIILFNGDGYEYDAALCIFAKRAVDACISTARLTSRESPLHVTLAQAIARGEKMDWVIQKATELGVSEIVPIITERTEVRLHEDRTERRMAHWLGVITASCEQCGRTRLPKLHEPQKLANWVSTLPSSSGIRLALLPEGEEDLRSLLKVSSTAFTIVVGPEGGFSEQDAAILRSGQFHNLKLGPRILRTETAGCAALAAINALAGDF